MKNTLYAFILAVLFLLSNYALANLNCANATLLVLNSTENNDWGHLSIDKTKWSWYPEDTPIFAMDFRNRYELTHKSKVIVFNTSNDLFLPPEQRQYKDLDIYVSLHVGFSLSENSPVILFKSVVAGENLVDHNTRVLNSINIKMAKTILDQMGLVYTDNNYLYSLSVPGLDQNNFPLFLKKLEHAISELSNKKPTGLFGE